LTGSKIRTYSVRDSFVFILHKELRHYKPFSVSQDLIVLFYTTHSTHSKTILKKGFDFEIYAHKTINNDILIEIVPKQIYMD
jgi:hypothetical protein